MKTIYLAGMLILLVLASPAMATPTATNPLPAVIVLQTGETTGPVDLNNYFSDPDGALTYVVQGLTNIPYTLDGSNLTLGPSSWVGTEQMRVIAWNTTTGVFIDQYSDVQVVPQQSPPAEIVGIVFNDSNKNGSRDPGESGLEGWTVKAKNETGFETLAFSDPEGAYRLTLPSAGTWNLSIVPQTGWYSPPPREITLGEGESRTLDFGVWEKKDGPVPPVPEMPAGILTAGGIAGLFLLMRVSRR